MVSSSEPLTRILPPGPAAAFPLGGGRVVLFERPEAVLVATTPAEVLPLLAEVEAVTAGGSWAAGFVAYEAAPGLDPALPALESGPLPLAWFGVFPAPRCAPFPRFSLPAEAASPPLRWTPSWSPEEYREAIAGARDAIARGDTYQVNLTWRLRAPFRGSPAELLSRLLAAQPVRYAAWLDLGRHVLASASPELFFRRRRRLLVSRPMKGTAPRGRWPEEDARLAAALAASPKERAENLMVVDMVRNDLARIARPGSVRVPRLWNLEAFASLWQLTSTVVADSAAPLPELMAALFPAASITGAPRASTMSLIAQLERTPRGAYTGAIGWVGPGGRARFNVAIRTLWVDRERGVAEYGTGGGVTWDSDPEAERAESLLKATLLLTPPPSFELLETMRWTPARGCWLLGAHLGRLRASAQRFAFRSPHDLEVRIAAFTAGLPPVPQRIRLRLAADGKVALAAEPLPPPARDPRDAPNAIPRGGRRPWRVALAAEPVDPEDPLIFHKTTRREPYQRALAGRPGHDDVLLWNPRGELTESTVANLVVRLGDRLLTPPVDCGLLAGTFRARLLARGTVAEGVVRIEDLPVVRGLWLVNSVRGWIPCRLACAGTAGDGAQDPLQSR